jgi:hypothetical protein
LAQRAGAEVIKVMNSGIGYDSQVCRGLTPTERRYLEQWQRAARAVGIDAVEDLSQRLWPCFVNGAVIGVFVEDDETAAWLVVKHNERWAVSCCADNTVSRSVESLSDALAQLYVLDDSSFSERS